MTKIAFIGLGNMGLGMCANLVEAGYQVTAYDLSLDAVALAVEKGAIGADSIAKAVQDSNVIITMLPNGQIVRAVYLGADGVADAAKTSSLFIDCSTISVAETRDIGSQARARGFAMLDAPVSGGTAASDAGSLTFMVGGARGAFDRALPVLEAMGKTIVHAGDSGNGQAAKIANNMLLGISMIGTCEAFALAERLGLSAQTFFDISSKASGQNWSMTTYCPMPGPVPSAPSNKDYEAGFAVDMMLKDLRLAVDASETVGASIDLGEMAEKTYSALSNRGYGASDFSIIMKSISAGQN